MEPGAEMFVEREIGISVSCVQSNVICSSLYIVISNTLVMFLTVIFD